MYSLKSSPAPSLDDQYLDFSTRTARVFERYPQLEPLRHGIFKDLIVRQNGAAGTDQIKQLIRPFLHRKRTVVANEPADVLMVVESRREVISEAILPVFKELESRGIRTQLLSVNGPDGLPSAIDLRWRPSLTAPRWARDAWSALCYEIEALRSGSLKRSFYYSATAIQGMLEECDRVLTTLKPKVILAASTQIPGGAAMIVAARKRMIPTLLLQHGILQAFYTPVPADYMLTWGESSNDTLLRLGVPPEKLVTTGSPRHDSMFSTGRGRARKALLDGLSLPERPTLVFFSNGNDLVRNGSAPIDSAAWLEATATRYEGFLNVAVRLHPNEDGSLYRACPHLKVFKEAPDLATTLEGSDIVASLCSTVLYDALLFNRPVWQFYSDGWPELADNWRHKLARRIASGDELDIMIERVLKGEYEHDSETAARAVFANHRFAASGAADFIVALQRSTNPLESELAAVSARV